METHDWVTMITAIALAIGLYILYRDRRRDEMEWEQNPIYVIYYTSQFDNNLLWLDGFTEQGAAAVAEVFPNDIVMKVYPPEIDPDVLGEGRVDYVLQSDGPGGSESFLLTIRKSVRTGVQRIGRLHHRL